MGIVYAVVGLSAAVCFVFLPAMDRFRMFPTSRDRAAVLLGVFFVFAGTMHFVAPDSYVSIMPKYFPVASHRPLVLISGFFEILGGLGVLLPATRRAAGWGLTLLLLAVFPANIDMALNGVHTPGLPANPVIYWARLPFQLFFIVWVLWCSNALRKKIG